MIRKKIKSPTNKFVILSAILLVSAWLTTITLSGKNDSQINKGESESISFQKKLLKTREEYGHYVHPRYTPIPTKNNTPRYSQFDPLGVEPIDTTYSSGNQGVKVASKIAFQSQELSKILQVKPKIYYADLIDVERKSKIKITENIESITVDDLNLLLAQNRIQYRVKLSKLPQMEFFSKFLNSAVFKVQQTSNQPGLDVVSLDYAKAYLTLDNIPIYFPQDFVGLAGEITEQNDNYYLEYNDSIRLLSKVEVPKIINYDQLNNNIENNIYFPFWVSSDWGNAYEGQVWNRVVFHRVGLIYVAQSKALLPYFYICGDGYSDLHGKADYFCALTEAVDYGDY